ncbi:MAG TPA: hypothetical protein VNV66_20775 [Pilimelia sp.]|nr:hypothetical protein [Pilimelia sp.]
MIAVAVDLLAWRRLLGCHDIGALNRAEPATLPYRLLHLPGRLVRQARTRWGMKTSDVRLCWVVAPHQTRRSSPFQGHQPVVSVTNVHGQNSGAVRSG